MTHRQHRVFAGWRRPTRTALTHESCKIQTIRTGWGILCLLTLWFAPGVARASTIAAGDGHTVVVTPDGIVWTWGRNGDGQLGDGTQTPRHSPTPVPGLSDVIAVSAGSNFTLVLKSDGTVWAWGANYRHQLGDGTSTRRLSPVPLELTDVVEIAAGADHGVAREADGTVWTWGYNSTGQLGDGTLTNVAAPVAIAAFASAASVAGGVGHTLVVKTDGTVWGAGYNLNGQLGDNSTTQRATPVQMIGITSAVAAAGGLEHSMILLADGTMRATGYNWYGQLGDDTNTRRLTPVPVSGLTGVASVHAGWWHSSARKADGTLWTWGYAWHGQLGLGHQNNRWQPTRVDTATGLSAGEILTSGLYHGIGVDATGVVWTWGDNNEGRLGDGTTTRRLSPTAISGPNYEWRVGLPLLSIGGGTYDNDRTITIGSATPDATIHYTLEGSAPTEADPSLPSSGGNVLIDRPRTLKARAWKAGWAPSGTTTAVYAMVVGTPTSAPAPWVTYATPQTVTLATTSSGATIHYTTDGTTPTTSAPVYTAPVPVTTTTTVKAIGVRPNWTTSAVASATYTMRFGTLAAPTFSHATGPYTSSVTVTITASAAATIRYTTNGSAPNEASAMYTGPLAIASTTALKAASFHPDYYTSAVTTATYTIHVAPPTFSLTAGTHLAGTPNVVSSATTGVTITYTLHGADPTQTDPTIASGGALVVGTYMLKARAWKPGCTASAIVSATYAVTGTSAVPVVDGNGWFSVALREDGTVWTWGNNRIEVSPPAIVPGVTGVTAIDSGSGHVLAVRDDGTVVAWGGNGGRLGDGTTGDRWTPGPVSGLTDVTAVAGGHSHSVARKADGTVWTWGSNGDGQLGDGTTALRLTPVQVTGLTDVVAIAAGDRFTVAVKADGTVWTWGTAQYGLLGDGSTVARATPGQVPGVASVTAVAAGPSRILVRHADGTVVAWGNSLPSTPTAVAGLTNIAATAGGTAHALALAGDGQVWSWGHSNFYGQLGDGTNTPRTTPAAISGLDRVIAIAAGEVHALAIDEDHAVWAWGSNYYGQLGDNTFTDRNVPTLIAGPGMHWKVRTPTLSVGSGTYATAQSVVVTCGELDLLPTLHYTTTGIDPTESDPTVACGGTVVVAVSQTLKVSGWRAGAPTSVVASATYQLKVVTPTLLPATGTYATPQTVTMTTSTPGVTFRYTLDGSEPTAESTVHGGGLTVVGSVTLRIRAFKEGWTPSDIAQQSYWISEGPVAPPAFTPAAGTHTTTPWVHLTSATPGATIRYTTDGSAPTLQSPVYRYPFLVPVTATITAQAYKPGFTLSAVVSATYTVEAVGTAAVPTVTPSGGTFTTWQLVVITGSAGATLRYTTTGTDPTETDPIVASGATLTIDRSLPLKVRAWQASVAPSAVRTVVFRITGALSSNGDHTLALKADGTVWAWGSNQCGQLGDGTITNRLTPVQVLTDAVAVSAGWNHSLAIRRDGTVWGWGCNGDGRVGDGTNVDRRSPVQVSGVTQALAVAGGGAHSLAVTADGTVWAWGEGGSGQLGHGEWTRRFAPVRVQGVPRVVRIAAGMHSSYAIESGGAAVGVLWAWGSNGFRELADGSTLNRPQAIRVPRLGAVVEVAAGREWAAATREDGLLFAWGRNTDAQLASGTPVSPAPWPVTSPLWSLASHVVLGHAHAALLGRLDGRVWIWGHNGFGQTGEDSYPYAYAMPHPIREFRGWSAAGFGAGHSVVADATGAVWAAGWNAVGQLGDGTTTSTKTFQRVPNFTLADNAWLAGDADGDGLPTWREFLLHTDPLVMDTNGNGIPDGAEVDAGRVPDDPDADGDGLSNWAEAQRGTDPFNPDSDGDLVNDRLDQFPLDPTRSSLPPPDPNDHTPPVITLIEPTNARPVP